MPYTLLSLFLTPRGPDINMGLIEPLNVRRKRLRFTSKDQSRGRIKERIL